MMRCYRTFSLKRMCERRVVTVVRRWRKMRHYNLILITLGIL